jgi:putative addiction module component (TIGR02574 family)
MGDPARILEEALDLPPSERARVARALIDSLDDTIDQDADELWDAEIRRRLDAIKSGEVQLEDWAVVRDRLYAQLKKP